MNEFEVRMQALNAKQREAVNTIEGPVMVVAGPGTGKTELLSMRVANILAQTDVSPNNILCLTFTESGAYAMRERLIGLIGQDAYRVAIHTFHSFGTEVINSNPDYFYRGAHFRPADELSSYEVLRSLFEKLPHNSPIGSTMNGEFTALRDTQRAISQLKQSGLTPDELNILLDHNEAFTSYSVRSLKDAFSERLSKKTVDLLEDALIEIGKYQDEPIKIIGYEQLSTLFTNSAQRAIEASREQNSTKPLRAWRDDWLEKDDDGNFVFKDTKRNKKLRAVAAVYYDYLVAMQERELYDFDDMILRVVHALEVFGEMRLNLQEQYQYILVDEFQDTNNAQMRLLWNLTNNEVTGGRPNLLVVGDDDQAIYRFQGADISNILDFRKNYKDPASVTLTDNYRSAKPILDLARNVIVQGEERLENILEGVNKALTPKNGTDGNISLHTHSSAYEEYYWIAESIRERIEKQNANPSSIAVIARKHSDLQEIMPYLHRAGVPVQYERQDNILESEPIKALELLANVVNDLGHGHFAEVDAMLPELLAHPAWHVAPVDLWQLGMKAYKNRRSWLEEMLATKNGLRDIGEWLIIAAHIAKHESLEQTLDVLLGTEEIQAPEAQADEPAALHESGVYEGFISPLRGHFFPESRLKSSPDEYLSYLSALNVLRRRLREYRPDQTLTLSDFCEFIDLHHKTSIIISATDEFRPKSECVQLMTAHKAKGLEFDTVYVTSLTDNAWGATSRSRGSSVVFPHNLPLAPAGSTEDERLRLLYVALTRARSELVLSAHRQNSKGKDTSLVAYLVDGQLKPVDHEAPKTTGHLLTLAETAWRNTISSLQVTTAKELLAPILEHYTLSSTHLNNFLDVSSGGPQAFLLQNLLRFPQAMSPSAAFGSAVHATLQRAHAHLSATGKRRPVEDVLSDFEGHLAATHMSPRDLQFYLHKGSDVLHAFLDKRYSSFSPEQLVERSFSSQGVVIDDVRLTGSIDVINIKDGSKTVTVTDYKTGKSSRTWRGKTDFEKIKLHKYKQQLMLYKLLIENARDFGKDYQVEKGVLEFVEPAPNGDIVQLEIAYENDELEQFKALLKAVWQHIQDFNLPDTSGYEPAYKGMRAFEQDLLDGKI
jgi:DNA helicase-2/ATP-dependent DNA helicase PcrA